MSISHDERRANNLVYLLLWISLLSVKSLNLSQEGAARRPMYGVPTSMLPLLPSGKALKLGTKHGGVLGGTVWPAASVLCSYLAENQHDLKLKNSHCVELGSGTGAVGLYAAGLGAASVILTDCRPPPDSAMYTTDGTCTLPPGGSDTILNLLEQNVEANEAIFCGSSGPRVMELDWTEDSNRVVEAGPTRNGFDIVLASDVTHFSLMHQPLASTIAKLLRSDEAGVCLLSHQKRMVNLQGEDLQLKKFEETAHTEGLDVEYVPFLSQAEQGDAILVPHQPADLPKSILLLRHSDDFTSDSPSKSDGGQGLLFT
jgi:predicted nicotinamide N-methyase